MESTGCVVRENCFHAFECDFCQPGYRDYQPINVHILSPAQLERREGKKASAKERKKSEASKRGRRNRQMGKRAEKGLLSDLESDGLDIKQVALSGALAGKNLVGGSKNYDGDLHLVVGDETYLIESKSGEQTMFLLKKITSLPAYVGSRYTILSYTQFVMASRGELGFYVHVTIPDTNKKLKEFFDQDKADIVALKHATRDWVFVLKNEVMDKWSLITPPTKNSKECLQPCEMMTRRQRIKSQKSPSPPKPTTKRSWPKPSKKPANSTTKQTESRRTFPTRKARTTSQKGSA